MDDDWWCQYGHKNREYESVCTDCGTSLRGSGPSRYVPPEQRRRLSARQRARIVSHIKQEEATRNVGDGVTQTPRCPTCQSDDVRHLSLTSRGISGLAGGLLFSRRARAHFTCKSCGYNW